MYFCLVAAPGPFSLKKTFLGLPLGTYADLCWRVGKTGRRGEVEDREVSCSSLFPSDADWPWWYYVIGVVLTMILCPCFCFFACAAWAVIKGCYDGCCEPETILNAGVYISFKIHLFVTHPALSFFFLLTYSFPLFSFISKF